MASPVEALVTRRPQKDWIEVPPRRFTHDRSSVSVLVQGLSISGDPQRINEDALTFGAVKDYVYGAIFDGTTSLVSVPEFRKHHITGAWFAAHSLAEQIPLLMGSEPHLMSTFLKMNRQLGELSAQVEGIDLQDQGTLPASTGTAIRIQAATNVLEVAHVGDSFCLIQYENPPAGNPSGVELVTQNKNKAFDQKNLEVLVETARENRISPRQARQEERVKQALLDSFRYKMNRPDGQGIGIFNGDEGMEKYLEYRTFSLDKIARIVLASDGAVPPNLDIENPTHRYKIMNIIRGYGIQGLMEYKQAVEKSDPDWVRYPRFKNSDDATILEFQIAQPLRLPMLG